MTNQPNKATVKYGLPTADALIEENLGGLELTMDDEMWKFYSDVIRQCMQSYSDQQNAELLERVKELEFGAQVDSDCIESQSNEIDELKAWKESAMTEAEKLDIQSIGMEIGCKLGSSIPEQVLPWIREQKAKIASYESAIDGLKKVIDSLYNLK